MVVPEHSAPVLYPQFPHRGGCRRRADRGLVLLVEGFDSTSRRTRSLRLRASSLPEQAARLSPMTSLVRRVFERRGCRAFPEAPYSIRMQNRGIERYNSFP
jgi:hypothetical protein